MKYITILFAVVLLVSCSPKSEPIDYGNDVCDFCKMNITDNKYAAELVTSKGKVYKFDSIECLFQFKDLEFLSNSEIHAELVNDFSNPGELIDLRKAFFLKSDVFRSPMGMNVLSVSSEVKLSEIKSQHGGQVLTYSEVRKLASEQ
mgnify:CR=1 FL=1